MDKEVREYLQREALGEFEEEDGVNLWEKGAVRTPTLPLMRSTEPVEHLMAGLFALWKAMVFTIEGDEFFACWTRMKAEFNDQQSILAYLEEHYLPYKEEWAATWTTTNLNFGQRTTSLTESAHCDIKSFLLKGTLSLLRLDTTIQAMLTLKEETYNLKLATQKAWLRTTF